jgi:26S proteasome regulatory subunit T1
VLKTYGAAPYGAELRKLEKEIKDKQSTINEKIGVKVAIPTTTMYESTAHL